jgi:hypothetical protein
VTAQAATTHDKPVRRPLPDHLPREEIVHSLHARRRVGKAAFLMRPLVEALGREMMRAERLFADNTPVPVLAPGTGKTRTGRLWAYVRDGGPMAARPGPP